MELKKSTLFKISALTVLLCYLSIDNTWAQNNTKSLQQLSKQLGSDPKVSSFEVSPERGSLQSVLFSSGNSYPVSATDSLLGAYFGLRGGMDSYLIQHTDAVDEHISVARYQQFFKGVIVEYGTTAVASNDGNLAYLNSEYYPLPDALSTTPVITESTALTKALDFIGATKYMWEEDGTDASAKIGGYPKGALVFINDFLNGKGVQLAYKFDIYATEPLSRDNVYISAVDGSVLFKDAILKHTNATATAATKYSGTKTITTDYTGTAYRLRETLPTMMGIETFNMHKTTNYNQALEVTDADNNWTAAEYDNATYDNALLDAHWGAEQVYSFWKNIQGRNSYDNAGGKIKSYVHFSTSYDNAYWNGNFMTYGDGSYPTTGGFKALTSLDVCGHEIGHGVCQYTANLAYQKESGAMNEAFSDIWAACIEHNADPTGSVYDFYLVGEQITPTYIKGTNRNALRDMKNPKAQGQPDTYTGTNWVSVTSCTPSNGNDQCGVHTNSGVLNKWFYLLTAGGTGTNDLTNAYTVVGVDFAKSQKITYLTELTLTSSATHATARTAAMSAATTLYGACSPEVIATTNAWYAVGVGAVYSGTCSPQAHFISSTGSVSEGNTATTCHPSKTITTTVRLDGSATQNTTVTFTTGGTATVGQDYDISPASLTFPAGSAASQDVTITIYDDAIVEGTETLVLGYTLNANGGNAAAGSSNQTYTLSIQDDDAAPSFGTTTSGATTLLSEDFGTTGGTLPTGWTTGAITAGLNSWVVGANGGVNTGQGAYITNNTTTKPLAYTVTSTSTVYLRTPLINAANTSGMTLSFKYKCLGEQDNNGYYDYGLLEYSLDGGTTFKTLPDILQNVTTATTYTMTLPDSLFANTNFKLGFRWTNDNSVGTSPPFSIDDVLLTGTQTINKVSIATTTPASKSEYVPATAAVNFYTTQNKQMLSGISGLSATVGCMDLSLTQTGSGQVAVATTQGSYMRTQKVFQLSPPAPDNTTNYQLTLYFTPAELAIWGSEKLNLKFLKVQDGVNLSGTLMNSNAVLVNPSSVNDQSANGYIAYTGNFTGFSQFMLVNRNTVLPLDFLQVQATPGNQLINVAWATAGENGQNGYYVERSIDGIHFAAITWVAGNGNTTTRQEYKYADKDVTAGITYYYRIRQQDESGSMTYSETCYAALKTSAASVFTLSPNPAKNVISIIASGAEESASIRILNAQGMVVRSFASASLANPFAVDIAALPAGVYMVTMSTGSGNWTGRFVKE